MFSSIQTLMYMRPDNGKKEVNIMKVFNLHPLLFSNIMALLIPLLRPVKIIYYLDLKKSPTPPLPSLLGRTLWSVESRMYLEKVFAFSHGEEKDCNVLYSHDKLLKLDCICAAQ